jgi:hypothetical protein
MSRTGPIQVGDMVVVVRGTCLCVRGHVFRVGHLHTPHAVVCRHCFITRIKHSMVSERVGHARYNVPLEWCDRIPPLSELEHTDIPATTPQEHHHPEEQPA